MMQAPSASNLQLSLDSKALSSEEYASSLVYPQKRRDRATATPKSPSHGSGLLTPTLTLRPYQQNAVNSLRLGLGRGKTRQILYSPTGSGKTEMGSDVIKGAIRKGKRVAFLCNRIHLVNQTSLRFTRSGIDHGVIQGQNTRDTHKQVLICSIQTIAKRGLPQVDLLVIDEAHGVAGSKEFRNVVINAGCPVIGLTATPWSKGLGAFLPELGGNLFEEIVIAATIPELIADGYLVDVDVYAPSAPDMSAVKQSRNAFGELDYSDMDVGKAVDKPELVGDIVKHWLRLAKGTATVCFAASIAHSQHIVAEFVAAGIRAEHIDCYTDEDERKAVLARIETGETTIISNVGILAEGWDFPACRTLILARPTKSLIRFVQMAGRVLRPHPSKTRALILDHSGTVTKLGFPTDDFPMELDDGTVKDGKPNKDAEEAPNEKLPKACPECSYVKPAGVFVCPVCNHKPILAPNVTVKDGELVKVEKSKVSAATAEEKQQFYSGLMGVAEERGYQRGWVSNAYKEKFGVWPRSLLEIAAPASPVVKAFLTYRNIRRAKGGVKHANA